MSDPGTKNPQNTNPITREPIIRLSSLSLKSVFLYDWWLVKLADGNSIAVAGLASREREGSRLFCSATIVKRHDTTILEAKDGIIITVTGFINHAQTIENGFSLHVCSRFRLGFPYCWEEYATKDCSEGSGDGAVPMGESRFGKPGMSSAGNVDTSLHVSWVDLPVQRIQDLLLCTVGDSKAFVDDIIGQFFSPPPRHTPAADHSDLKNKTPSSTTRPAVDKTPIRQKKRRSRGVNETLDISGTVLEECVNPKRGVVTRRMAASSMSACLDVENRPSVATVNPVSADETPRKNKKAWDGKKPRDTCETLDVTGVVEECIDWHRGVSTRSMAGNLKSTHTPKDAFHSGIESRNLVKTANPLQVDEPSMKNKKTRIGKSKDMGGALDVAGLVEESIDQHGGVATRSTDGNPKSAHPPRDAFRSGIENRTLVKTANPVQVDETSRRKKKARNGKSKDTIESPDVAGVKEECIDQERGATRSMAGKSKSAHPPSDVAATLLEERFNQHGSVATRSMAGNPTPANSDLENETPVRARNPLADKNAKKDVKTKAIKKCGDAVETSQLSRGVVTRSMSRLRNL